MHQSEGKKLIDNYLAWLKEGFSLAAGEDHLKISTPFLDPHNDEIEIYVQKAGDLIKLTDDGYTIADLVGVGLEINTEKRKTHVRQIVNGFGVKWEADGQLTVTTTARDFPQKKHNLIQAILAVHDLSVMGQPHVLQFFEEDVAAFLLEKNIPFIPGVKFTGRSGLDHHFDFAFPKLGRRPESVMRAANMLTRDFATSVAFAVNDVRLQRGEKNFVAHTIINDRDVKPSEDNLNALRAYGVTPYRWSERDNLVADFSAN